jgi:hypothetical protein
LFSAKHYWVWLGLGLDACSRKAREKIPNTSQGRYYSVEDLYSCQYHVSGSQILIWHLWLVCSGMKMTGMHLQIWAVRMQRQGSRSQDNRKAFANMGSKNAKTGK